MKRHFKHWSDSDLGEGVCYVEFTGDWPSRQVEIAGDTWRWGDNEHSEWLADQPFSVCGLDDVYKIPEDEFERIWQEAMRRSP